MNTTAPATSLYEAFASVADPRSRFGRSYTLASLLTLAAVAMLCGCRSLYAIAQWGRGGIGRSRTGCTGSVT